MPVVGPAPAVAAALAVTLALTVAAPVTAQPAAADTATEPTTRQLLQQLRDRDLIIANLLQRVERLERGATAAAGGAAPPSTSPPASTSPPRAAPPSAPAGGGPGAFEVDEETAERALERTLTTAGALLLSPGALDVSPFFQYSRNDGLDTVTRIFNDQDGVAVLGINRESEQNSFTFGAQVRYGLPGDAQLELRLPYRVSDETLYDQTFDAGGQQFRTVSDGRYDDGFGDISVGIARTLSREQGWRPDLVGRLIWDTDTGGESDGVSFGTGYDELEASLTAVKRLDPLALTGRLSYRYTFEDDGVQPGDELGLALGVSLAASPETALSATLQQVYADETEVDGRAVNGSDRFSSSLVLGASWIVDQNVLLSVSPGIGLNDDAADYFLNLSASFRLR